MTAERRGSQRQRPAPAGKGGCDGRTDEKEIRDYRVDQLKFKPKRRRDRGNVNDAELKALEALEKKEGKSKLDDN